MNAGRWCLGLVALAVLGAAAAGPARAARPGPEGWRGHVRGTVTDAATGQPLAGALAQLPALNLSAPADEAGAFAWQAVALPGEVFTTSLIVTAPGYGQWTLEGVRLLANDTLLITAELGQEPARLTVPPPRALAPAWPDGAAGRADLSSADAAALALPETVRVRVTGQAGCNTSLPYTVVTVPFRDYVRHVLPNEWIAGWRPEALRAGAMAVKMYAWYWAARGGKWPDADVYDSTCDQVYNPAVAYASTDAAVDETWPWRLARAAALFPTFYRAHYDNCDQAGLAGNCMGQWESQWMAQAGLTWSQIVLHFYSDSTLARGLPPLRDLALRFHGSAEGIVDQVRIALDDPASETTGPLINVGAEDFTIEWWMRAAAATAPAVAPCGDGEGWRLGTVLLDGSRAGGAPGYGVALAGGRLAWGVVGEAAESLTLCGATVVADEAWHHVAVARRRSDGWLWLWVDGQLEAQADGPDGDIAYPGGPDVPDWCGLARAASCASSDPYLVIGAPKRSDGQAQPGYQGWLDEVRFSAVLRYTEPFEPPAYLAVDAATAALFSFDEARWPGPCAGSVNGMAGAAGPASLAQCHYGGSPPGPEWSAAGRWAWPVMLYLPFTRR